MVTESFLSGRKSNISLVFISQSYLEVPKTITRNVTHHFIKKIPKENDLKQITSNHWSNIEFQSFINSVLVKLKTIDNEIK